LGKIKNELTEGQKKWVENLFFNFDNLGLKTSY
jgi:hypothetical protein